MQNIQIKKSARIARLNTELFNSILRIAAARKIWGKMTTCDPKQPFECNVKY
jgi:hypothetical protein